MGLVDLKRRLRGLIDIRTGEFRRLAPLVLTYSLVMMSVYVLKPVRNALFLNSLGINQLPYVLLLVAVVGGLTASVYSRFVRSVRIDRLIFWTFLFLISNLGLFRWILLDAPGWVFYVFYVWVNLYGLMAIALLWLLANAAFNSREARRLFGFIGTGGIAGAILGGIFTGWAVERVGTENLLVVCMGLLGVCVMLVRTVRPADPEESFSANPPSGGVLASVARSDLLRSLGYMAALTAVVAAIADVQFNQIASEVYPAKDDKTAFFGEFFAYLNGFAFLFQLLVTPRVLRLFGVGTALMFLPLSLGAGSLAVLLIPGLIGGIAVKVGDIGFRHSIHKSAVEILYLPVPSRAKRSTKVFLDTTVDNVATGLGALLVLALTGPLGASYRSLSFVSLVLVAGWVAMLVRVRRAYVDAFRQALDRREIDPAEFRVHISDAASLNALNASLSSGNDRQIIYALDLLTAGAGLTDSVVPLLEHPSAEVRQRALQVLYRGQPGIGLVSRIESLIGDADSGVRMEAMRFMCRHGGMPSFERLKSYLTHEDAVVRATALGCIAAYGTLEEQGLVDRGAIESVLENQGSTGVFGRVQAAKALGVVRRPVLRPFLETLMEDASPRVVQETIRSLGRMGDLDDVPWLLEKLVVPEYRLEARSALAALGPRTVPILTGYFDGEDTVVRVRRNIPGVLGEIRHQDSVDALLERLGRTARSLEYPLLKGLNKLRRGPSELRFDSEKVDAALKRETHVYYDMQEIRFILKETEQTAGVRLLSRALGEKREEALDRLFRMLALVYSAQDMYHAYLGIVSTSKEVRASALEFLENVLERDTKELLFPLLDPVSEESARSAGYKLFGRTFRSWEEALQWLLEGRDPWLRACAINCVHPASSAALIRAVGDLQEDPEPLVSETARMVIGRVG